MKKTIAVATALFLGTSTLALAAQGYKSNPSSTSSSHEMHKSKMSKGASTKNKGTVGQSHSSTKGASQTSGTNKETPKY